MICKLVGIDYNQKIAKEGIDGSCNNLSFYIMKREPVDSTSTFLIKECFLKYISHPQPLSSASQANQQNYS